ncbi:helix-turn-helix domain-containing protein [Motilimonas pumila]|uniref:AraC family transcriptional regulator n=1 Tax=Motilimonas pumila TaxID=2303987 RepID=A0A418YD96_9GAMM|nr:helix-turn-helix transcriptional regulator [Motilimonas pumila]RJG42502.1 AraC family transcriptional regulator [Motilimonas pumila]
MTNAVNRSQDIPLFLTEYTVSFVRMLQKMGEDIYPILEQAGLPHNLFENEYQYVPEEPVQKLLTIMSQKMSSQYCQIMREQCRTEYVPNYLRRFYAQSTVEQAIEQYILYIQVDSPQAKLSLKHLAGKHYFIREKTKQNQAWFAIAEQFALIFMIELVRGLTHSGWMPEDVGLQTDDLSGLKSVLDFSQSRVFTGRSATVISIQKDVLQMPARVAVQWQPQSERPAPVSGFLDTFRLALLPYLSLGRMSIKEAADRLGMSARTLQRRLKQEQVTYSELVDEILLNNACAMMRDKHISVTRISAALGYSDVAHFSRAFKRLKGVSPRVYRARLQHEKED